MGAEGALTRGGSREGEAVEKDLEAVVVVQAEVAIPAAVDLTAAASR